MLFGPPHISSLSMLSAAGMGLRTTTLAPASFASAAWAAANLIAIVGIRVSYPFLVSHMFTYNGATDGTDSWAVGVYSADGGARLVNSANTLHAGTNALQVVAAATPYELAPGNYWMALGMSGTTATFFNTTVDAQRASMLDVFQQASGYSSGLPSSLTIALATNARIPIFGISQGSVI